MKFSQISYRAETRPQPKLKKKNLLDSFELF